MSRREVEAAVRALPDPELPFVTIEDLGILRGLEVEGDTVRVTITPTYSGCPAMDQIREDIEALVATSGLRAEIETVLAPAWTTDWMTERGRAALAANGIAPPSSRGPVLVQLSERDVARATSGSDRSTTCPQCGSFDTEELSRFGSTACKSMWRCLVCREPFDHFKAH